MQLSSPKSSSSETEDITSNVKHSLIEKILSSIFRIKSARLAAKPELFAWEKDDGFNKVLSCEWDW